VTLAPKQRTRGPTARQQRSYQWGLGRRQGRAGVVPVEASGPRARGLGARGHHREAGHERAAATRQTRRRDVFPAMVALEPKGNQVGEME